MKRKTRRKIQSAAALASPESETVCSSWSGHPGHPGPPGGGRAGTDQGGVLKTAEKIVLQFYRNMPELDDFIGTIR